MQKRKTAKHHLVRDVRGVLFCGCITSDFCNVEIHQSWHLCNVGGGENYFDLIYFYLLPNFTSLCYKNIFTLIRYMRRFRDEG